MYHRYEKKITITEKEIEKIEQGKVIKFALDRLLMISGEYYPTLTLYLEGNNLVSVFTIDYEYGDSEKILAVDTFFNIKDIIGKMFLDDKIDINCQLLTTEYPALDIQIAVTRKANVNADLDFLVKEALNFFVLLSGIFRGEKRYKRYDEESSPMNNEVYYDNVMIID